MNRRHFLTTSLAASLSSLSAQEQRPRRLLLRSSWQTINIGDIAHTPGVLHLLEEHLPGVEVRLWPTDVKNGVEEMLRKRFPKVAIVKGAEELKAAFAECDFLLHGSGPGFVQKDVARWRMETGKPYGVYGITFANPAVDAIDLLSNARFVFFRDSHSLKFAQEQGCKCKVMDFAPDGAFAVDLQNDEPARAFLKAHGLEDGQFLCCIARFRNTPYWKIKKAAFDAKKDARNQAMKDHDAAPLLEAIIAVTRQTGMKVLLCPEDASQMAINKEVLLDKLPADVLPKVVWRENYWLTDEAISTYRRSAGLFGHEMHSPIMCIGNGIPAIVCRWAEQTSKGFMWQDIGLGDWLFDLDDEEQVKKVAPAVLAMAKDPAAAKAKAAQGLATVKKRQAETMAVVRKNLGA